MDSIKYQGWINSAAIIIIGAGMIGHKLEDGVNAHKAHEYHHHARECVYYNKPNAEKTLECIAGYGAMTKEDWARIKSEGNR